MHLGCDKNHGCVSLADHVARGKGAPRQGSLEMAGGRNLQARDSLQNRAARQQEVKEQTTRRDDATELGWESRSMLNK